MDVWQSIKDNRQWIFDGVGVAIVLTVGKLVHLWGIKKDKPVPAFMPTPAPVHQTGQTRTGHVINVNAPVETLSVGHATTNHPVKTKPETSEKMSVITPQEMYDDIKLAKPLQKEETAKNYDGLTFDWRGTFSGAEKKPDGIVRVHLTELEGSPMSCFCDVLLSDYPHLRVLASEKPMRIVGTIENATVYGYMTVKDAKLFF